MGAQASFDSGSVARSVEGRATVHHACTPEAMSRSGKTYLVSGGASGLGEATVKLLIAEGANVAILDRNVEQGEALVKELGPRCLFCLCDMAEEPTIKAAVEMAEKTFGGVDGAVCAAGVGAAGLILDKRGTMKTKIFDFVMKVNVYAVFQLCKYAAEAMAKRPADEHGLRGVLINVASVAAYEGQKGQVAYSASKGAIVGMTLPMARDLGRHGIRVMTIAPGIIDTPMMALQTDKVRQSLIETVVAPKRLGLPQEFAKMVTSIIDNTYLNGETIRLDGGLRMSYTSKVEAKL
eukprot:NODE_1829_length_1054_cov_379.435435.p1 GENE.NODE_1829_length_1054_cov_379.435435~~NODE_1829_length_1054_cov_379.435435.p1  ORF type:complete len:293 (+),score=120.87 NODE_1829_length_1054_cov_379.435435:3-881(+)